MIDTIYENLMLFSRIEAFIEKDNWKKINKRTQIFIFNFILIGKNYFSCKIFLTSSVYRWRLFLQMKWTISRTQKLIVHTDDSYIGLRLQSKDNASSPRELDAYKCSVYILPLQFHRKRRFPCLTWRDVAFKAVYVSLTAISLALSSKRATTRIPIPRFLHFQSSERDVYDSF